MRILFLDQSGNLGGAELALRDIAQIYHETCLVGLFANGPFRDLLEEQQIPVKVLTEQTIAVRKDSQWLQGLSSLGALLPLIWTVAQLAHQYDAIYANTQKALVVGALASILARRPLVYHLHDILSADHFSATNRRLAIALSNHCATQVIANSQATRDAFIAAGGHPQIIDIVYNGFAPDSFQNCESQRHLLQQEHAIADGFWVGHFSRLSPWKGQHILIEALQQTPPDIHALLVGDALFGEQDYVTQLKNQVQKLGLQDRVHFLGFQTQIAPLMTSCDLITHTSTTPEPFGRVIVEAMLCKTPVIAAQAGGAQELITHGQTGWLHHPNNVEQLAELILNCRNHPKHADQIAQQAHTYATQKFNLAQINKQIIHLLEAKIPTNPH